MFRHRDRREPDNVIANPAYGKGGGRKQPAPGHPRSDGGSDPRARSASQASPSHDVGHKVSFMSPAHDHEEDWHEDFDESSDDSDHIDSDAEDHGEKAGTCQRAERQSTLTDGRRAFAKEFKGHTCPIYDVRLSKNGTNFVTSCNDGTSMVAPCKAADIRKAGRKVKQLVDANDAVIRSEFVNIHRAGKGDREEDHVIQLIAGDDGTAIMYEWGTEEIVRTFYRYNPTLEYGGRSADTSPFTALAVVDDADLEVKDRFLLLATEKGSVYTYLLDNGKPYRQIERDQLDLLDEDDGPWRITCIKVRKGALDAEAQKKKSVPRSYSSNKGAQGVRKSDTHSYSHQGTHQVLLGCSDGYVRVYWLNSYGEILLEPNRLRDGAGPLYKYKWWHPLADIEDNIKAKNPAAASASQLNQQLQKRFDQKHHRGTGHRVSPAVTAMELAGTDLYVAYKSGDVVKFSGAFPDVNKDKQWWTWKRNGADENWLIRDQMQYTLHGKPTAPVFAIRVPQRTEVAETKQVPCLDGFEQPILGDDGNPTYREEVLTEPRTVHIVEDYILVGKGDNKMNSMRFELELYSTKTVGTHSRWYSGRNKKYEDVDEADRNEQGRLLYRQSKQIHKSQWDCVKNSSVNKHAGPVREIACRPLEKEQVDELKSEGHHFHYESDHARTYQLATACGDGQIRFRYFEVPIGDGGMSNESVEDAAAAAAAADGPAAGAEGIPEPAKTMTNAIAYPRLESYMTKEGLTLPPFRDHKTTIHSICISHDGRYMVSSGDDVFVAKYDTVLGKSIGVFNYAVVPESSKSNRVLSVYLTPNDEFLLTCSDAQGGRGRVIIWDFESRLPLAQLGTQLGSIWRGHHKIATSVQFEELNINAKSLTYEVLSEPESLALSKAFATTAPRISGAGFKSKKREKKAREVGEECWDKLARKYQISIDQLKLANAAGFDPKVLKKPDKEHGLAANRPPLMEVTIPLHRAIVHSCSSDGMYQFDVLDTLSRYREWRTEERERNKRVETGTMTVPDQNAAELETWAFQEIACRDKIENEDTGCPPRWGIQPLPHQSFTSMCLSNTDHPVPSIKKGGGDGNHGPGHGHHHRSHGRHHHHHHHTVQQDSARYSAGKKYVFTASENKLVQMYALQDDITLSSSGEKFDAGGAPKEEFDFGHLIRTFAGHTDTVNSVTTSSDDTYVVSGSQDKTALAFLVKTGMVVQKFLSPAASSADASTVDSGGIVKVKLTSDDMYLMAAFEKGILCQYDFFTGEIVRKFKMFTTLEGTPATVRSFRFMDYWYQDPTPSTEEGGKFRFEPVRVANTHIAVTVDDRISVFDVDTNTPAIPYKKAIKSVQGGSHCQWVVEEPNEDNVDGTSFSVYIAEKPDKPGEQCIEIVDEKTGDLKFSSHKLKHFLKNKNERAKWANVGTDITCGTLWEDPRSNEDIRGLDADQHQHSAAYADTESHGAVSDSGTNRSVVQQKLKNRGVYYVVGTRLELENGNVHGLTFLSLVHEAGHVRVHVSMNTPNTFQADDQWKEEDKWDEDTGEDVPESTCTYEHFPIAYDRKRKSRHFLPLAEQEITCITVGDSNQYIAIGSKGNTVCIINVKSTDHADRFVRLGVDDLAAYIASDGYSSEGGSHSSDTDSRHSGDHTSVGKSSTGSGSKTSSLGKSRTSSRGTVGIRTTHDAPITAVQFSHSLDDTVQDIFSADKDGKIHQFRRDHDNKIWHHVAFYEEHWTKWEQNGSKPDTAVTSMNVRSGRRGDPRMLTVATEDGMVLMYSICQKVPAKSKGNHDGKLRNFPIARFAPKADTACMSAVAVDWSSRDGQGKGEGWVLAGGVGEKVYVYPLSWQTAMKTREELTDYAKDHPLAPVPDNEDHPTLDAPVLRPMFVLKLPASITNLSVRDRGEYRQMVIGMEQPRTAEEIKGREDTDDGPKVVKAQPATIYAFPQLCAFLYEDTIPYSFLRLMMSVDCANTDPHKQFATVAKAMKKTDPCAISVSSSWFFTYLARKGSATGLKKTLFASKIKEKIPCVTVSYYQLLEHLLDGYNSAELAIEDTADKKMATNQGADNDKMMVKDYGKCVQRIFKEMARSVKNHNDVSLGYAKSMYRHRQFNSEHRKDNLVELLVADPNWTDGGDASKMQRGLGRTFPAALRDFLDDLPLVAADRSVVVATGLPSVTTMVSKEQMLVERNQEVNNVVWTKDSVRTAKDRRKFSKRDIVNGPFKGLLFVIFSICVGALIAEGAFAEDADAERINQLLITAGGILAFWLILTLWKSINWGRLCGRQKRHRGRMDVPSIPLMTPYPKFGNDDFMDLLLSYEDPAYFGNAVVVAVVQDKWDSYGRTWYAYVLFVYILQVLAVAALPVLRSSKALEGVAHGYRDMPSVLILAVGGVLGILLELLQFFNGHRGKIGYFWRDGPNLYNILDCVRLTLTFWIVVEYLSERFENHWCFDSLDQPSGGGAACHCPEESCAWETEAGGPWLESSDGRILISITIYLYWFGLFELLKAIPGLGSAIQVAAAAAYEIKYQLLSLVLLILAASTAIYELASGPDRVEGQRDLFESFYSTYRMLVLVDMGEEMEDAMELSVKAAFVYAAIVVTSSFAATIVLINIIIAKLTDSFQRLQKQADKSRRSYQAEFYGYFAPFRNVMYRRLGKLPLVGRHLYKPATFSEAETEDWFHILAPSDTHLYDGRWKQPEEAAEKITRKVNETLEKWKQDDTGRRDIVRNTMDDRNLALKKDIDETLKHFKIAMDARLDNQVTTINDLFAKFNTELARGAKGVGKAAVDDAAAAGRPGAAPITTRDRTRPSRGVSFNDAETTAKPRESAKKSKQKATAMPGAPRSTAREPLSQPPMSTPAAERLQGFAADDPTYGQAVSYADVQGFAPQGSSGATTHVQMGANDLYSELAPDGHEDAVYLDAEPDLQGFDAADLPDDSMFI